MPIKHQTESYRNRVGLKFECWNDEPTKETALALARSIRFNGRKAFIEKQDGGTFYRVFREVRP